MGEYIVAYIDILGATNIIKSVKGYQFFTNMQSLFASTLRFVKEYEDLLEYNIFSDNVLVAVNISQLYEQTKKELYNYLVSFVYDFQKQAFLNYGYLSRGAITIGELYSHNKVMASGRALVRAYEMEKEIAIYPRVIIDDEVLKTFNDYSHLKLCEDGLYMVNYISLIDFGNTIRSIEIIKLYRLLADCWDDLKVRSKIIWLMNQYEKSFDNIKFDTSKKPTKEFIYSLVLKSRKKEKDVNN